MALTVKKAVFWRKDVEDQPGVLAEILEPLAQARANFKAVVGYAFPGGGRAAINLYPVTGAKVTAAARGQGLAADATATLLVEGDDRPGLGREIASAISGAGINLRLVIAQVVGRRFSAILGFRNEADARKASTLIKKAARPARR